MMACMNNYKHQYFVIGVNNFIYIVYYLTRPVGPALTLVWVFQLNCFNFFDIHLFSVCYTNHVISSAHYGNASHIYKKGCYTPHWERAVFILIPYITREDRCILLLMNFLFQNHPT